MFNETVSNAAINGMAISLAIAVLFPIFLLLFWKLSQRPKLISFFVGAATFIVFALIIEQLFHTVVMMGIGGGDMLAGRDKMQANIWLYGLYGGICAAVFEEVGRFIAMKFCMKNFLDKKNAIMYGIGHGGIEAIIIVGISEISNIATAVAINSGSLESVLSAVPQDQREVLYEQVSALWTAPAADFYMAGLERVIAILLHIGLSYLVYRFVKYKEKNYFFMALAIHFLVDFGTVVMSQALPMMAIEAILAVVVIVLIVFVVNKYKNENETATILANEE